MRKNVVLAFIFVLMFSCIFCFLPGTALADNEGKVRRDLKDPNHPFLSVQFSVSSNAHSTGTVYRTTGLKIGIGPFNAFFDQAYLTSKGFYSSSSSNTVDFTAGDIALRSGATVEQIRAAANDISNGFNLGAQIKVLQNGVVKATIEEKNQVAPIFNQYGLGSCIAAAETRWGWAYDPYKPITLTMQIEGQGSTTPTGSQAPGTVYSYNLHDTVQLSASPIGGWKFAYWYDVLAGNSIATTTQHNITMNKSQTIRAIFIPDAATPPAVTPSPPEPPAPEPPPPPPPPPNYDPVADFDISNPTPVEGQTVQLRDRSTHPGAANGESIVSWEWTIESGSPETSTQQDVNAKWDTVGTYKITLRVEDQDGDSDSCTKSVVVGPALPAAVITLSSDSIILGREVHIDGDQSTAAMGRSIKWDEMDWKIFNPAGTLAYSSSNRYPLGKGTSNERTLTNSVLNQTGTWTIKLKVKDTNDNESEQVTSILTIYPDNPPIADFWLVSESLRNSYQGYELTVHDQSHPAAPDGALGDEIFQRSWTLYYDANNNGVFNVAGADSATLTTTSGNDQYPKIRFKKTGKYKLELTVRERATVWGILTNGLSGNTSGKALEEKQVTVINLAPTVAFKIKKKMPVDVQFAAVYSVPDSKYNSLQSSQAGFIAALEAGGIDPVTGVQRVQAGELGENFTNTMIDPYPYHTTPDRITYSMGVTQLDTAWSQTTISAFGYRDYRQINTETGQTKTSYYSGNPLLLKLDDGTYWQNISGAYSNGITHMNRVNANLDVIVSGDTYNNAANASVPANNDGWTFSKLPYTLNEDGAVYLIKGVKVNDVKFYLAKMAPNATVSWIKEIGTVTVSNPDQVNARVVHRFPNSNQYLVAIGWSGYVDSYENLYLVNPNSSTLIKQHTFMYHTPQGYTGKTSNGKYFIDVKYPDIKIYNSNGTVVANAIMSPYPSIPDGWYADRCVYIGSFDNTRSAAVFQNISGDGNKVDVRIILIDNSTGQIVTDKSFHDDFYPGGVGALGEYEGLQVEVTPLLPGIFGIRCIRVGGSFHSTNERYYSAVVDSNLNIRWISPTSRYWVWGDTAKRESLSALNADTILRTYSEQSEAGSYHTNITLEQEVFSSSSFNQIKYFPLKNYYAPNSEYYKIRALLGYPGHFLVRDSQDFGYRMYNSSGVLLWQKNYSEGAVQPGLFMNMLVLAATEGGKPVTKLVNIATGNVINTIPHEYLWNDSNNLLCYGIKADGTRDGTIKSFSQKQGLQYLSQVINSHSWDNQKSNFAVSIIDSDKYKDYSTKRDSVISQLKTNHLKLAVISPSAGQTKGQGEYLMNQAEGGWWLQTAASMPGPLAELAQKIIALVNLERGADNIVLVNQKVELTGNYSDPETDPAGTMRWEFNHDPYKLGSYSICNSMGMSSLNGAQLAVPPTAFDKVGTFQVRYRAKDTPVTNAAYLNDPKAGAKWSSLDAYLTVLVHRKPIAAFTLSSTTINKTDNLIITDNSYDPDLVTTDPEGKKGLRNWEWQYRNTTTGEEWKSSAVIPSSFTSKGVHAIRLRVRDAHGAWSDWTDQQLFTVLNNKPVAAFDALPNPVFVNNPCSLIDSSYDPDGDPLASWEWTIQGIGTLNKVNPNPFPVSWPNVGDYLVTLRVRDNDGVWSDPVSQTVKVINYFMLTLESVSIQNGRGAAIATPGGNPPGPSGLNRVNAPVFPVNITSNEIGAYSLNQQVTLTAEPVTSGTYFVEWREGDEVISRNATLTTRMGAQWLETVNNNTTCTISMTGNRTITAVFIKDPDFIPAVPPKTHVYIVK